MKIPVMVVGPVVVMILTGLVADLLSGELDGILRPVLGPYYGGPLSILFGVLTFLAIYFEARRHRFRIHPQAGHDTVGASQIGPPYLSDQQNAAPHQPPAELAERVKAMWPKVSSHLRSDLDASRRSARLATAGAIPQGEPWETKAIRAGIHSILTPLHIQVLSEYEPSLGQALVAYLQASDRLESASYQYTQYLELGGFTTRDVHGAKSEMFQAARKLLEAASKLTELVRYYDDALTPED